MATRVVSFLLVVCLALSVSLACRADFRVVDEELGQVTTYGRAFSANQSMVYVDRGGRLHYQSLVDHSLKWSKPGFQGPVSISSDGKRILAVRTGRANFINLISMSLWMFDSQGNALAKYPRDEDHSLLYSPYIDQQCAMSPDGRACLVKCQNEWLLLDGQLHPIRGIKALDLSFSTTGKYVIGTELTGNESTANMVAYRADSGEFLISRSSSPYSKFAAGPNDETYVQMQRYVPAPPVCIVRDLFSGSFRRLINFPIVVTTKTKWQFAFDDIDHGVLQCLNGGKYYRFRYSFAQNRIHSRATIEPNALSSKFDASRTYFDTYGNYLVVETEEQSAEAVNTSFSVVNWDSSQSVFEKHSESAGEERWGTWRDAIIVEAKGFSAARFREASTGDEIGKYETWERIYAVTRRWITTTEANGSLAWQLKVMNRQSGLSQEHFIYPGRFLFGPVTESGYTLALNAFNQLSIFNLGTQEMVSIGNSLNYTPSISAGYARGDRVFVVTGGFYYLLDMKLARIFAKRSLYEEPLGNLIGVSPSGKWTAWSSSEWSVNEPYFGHYERICVKDGRTGEIRCTLKGHLGGTPKVQFAGEDRLVSLGTDGDMKKWDLITGTEIASTRDVFYGNLIYANADATVLNFYLPRGGFVKATWD